ncbi:restriction endonuclease subunit S [Flavobacterium muglaense]|uniref:Restriction endonuclease subunit S n=1 Tax=Flavobacterium muglaense TaxID=2764716 RepID=A0A923N094_9FLAO|nr:restriction endonuclease subunit S [Flavobacterium muglaense]MBC5836697.1 restriction endonuclease subunit S [Flavobacterium muglaense]MBC5843353.1 restriction endonuclease subunit S [Flavobacterium muglaense]
MQKALKKYDQYKNSGVEWLGEIPEHWEVKRFKHIFSEKKKETNVELNCGSISFGKVVYKDDEKVPESTKRSYQVLSKGDFLINPLNLNYDLISLRIALSDKDVVVSSGYIILNENLKLDKNYYKWLLHIFDVVYMKTLGSGVRQTLSFTHIANSELVFPKIEEQTAIANFLYDKTTKIDQAIGIKQKQIELLKERRQILIHKAVTRGLDEDVKLKDSGVEWIGEIPEHWEVNKLFGLCNFIRGNSTFSKDELLCNGDYVALQYGKTYKVDEINDSYSFYVNDEFYKETQLVKYDDTILISTSETIEDLGHSAYYNRNDIGLIGGEQILLNPNNKKINGHYLYFYSKLFSKELRKYATGIKVFRFNVNNLKTIYLSIPSLSEQKQIVEYIETATIKIATAISLKEQEIEKLKEYKMSLIDGVVTGKVRVF